MEERIKKRLTGAVVLVALVVIFVPMLVEDDESGEVDISTTNIPPRPDFDRGFKSDLLPEADQPPIEPLPDQQPPSPEPGIEETARSTPAPSLLSPEPEPNPALRDTEIESIPVSPPLEAEVQQTETTPTSAPIPPPLASQPDQTIKTPEPKAEERRTKPDPEPEETPSLPAPVAPVARKPVPAPAPSSKPKPAPETASKPVQKTPSKPVPQPKVVPQPQAPEAQVGISSWVIQVAAVSSQARADDLVSSLRKKGFPAFHEQVYANKRIMYRVRVGPEIDRKLTEQMAQRLERTLDLKGRVIRYP